MRYEWEKNANDTSHQLGKTVYSINVLPQHLAQFQNLILKAKNGDSQAFNEVKRFLYNQTGRSDYTNPEALQEALGTEIANQIKGAGLNQSEVDAAVHTLQTTRSNSQALGALDVLYHAIDARKGVLQRQAERAHVPPYRIKQFIETPEAKAATDNFLQTQESFNKEQEAKRQGQGGNPPPTPNTAPRPSNRPPLSSFMRTGP
jgi:hypothetical protein